MSKKTIKKEIAVSPGCYVFLCVLLIILKIVNIVNLPWWAILAPLYIPLGTSLFIFIVMFLSITIVLWGEYKNKK